MVGLFFNSHIRPKGFISTITGALDAVGLQNLVAFRLAHSVPTERVFLLISVDLVIAIG